MRRKLIFASSRETPMANLMRTSNPALNEKAFKGQVAFGEAMTLQGTVNKTGFLLLCVVATAAWTWGLSHSPVPGAAGPWMIGGLFGMQVAGINGSGIVGIGFSLFVVVIAALNLVLDFDMIETGVRNGAPKFMEWYGAFGLMVTLIWLYLEILRLLAKARRR